MNLQLTTVQLSGLAFATAKRNAYVLASYQPTLDADGKETSTPPVPMTDEEFAADLLGVQLDGFERERISAENAALASNERLIAIGKAVAAQLDRLDAVEAAVAKALS